MFLLFIHPALIPLGMVGKRILDFYNDVPSGPHTPSDLLTLLIAFIAVDFQKFYYETALELMPLFPYIQPLEFPRIIGRVIKRVAKFIWKKIVAAATYVWEKVKIAGAWLKEKAMKLVKPLFAAGKGAAHYIKLVVDKVRGGIQFVFDKISNAVNNVA